jgi:predicted P-loop ATPase
MWQDFAVSDLARSGLALTDIDAEEANGQFGTLDGYKIPYYTIKNERHPLMWRVRMATGDLKYYQPTAEALGDDTAPPYFHKHCDYAKTGTYKIICEGEKKALSAFKFLQNVQTIGIGGCWNWQAPRSAAEKARMEADPGTPIMARLHPDIIAFCKGGKGPIYYVPDADYRTNEQVLRALGSMRLAFVEAKLELRIILLPANGKGLDDFLMAQPAGSHDAAFWALEQTNGKGMLTRVSDIQAKIGLRVDSKGSPTMIENLVVDALAKWDYLSEYYYYDTRTARHMLRGDDGGKPVAMNDIHIEALKRHMQAALGFTRIPRDFMESVLYGLALKFPRNPLAEHLSGLVWDGEPRFPKLVEKLGVPERLRGYATCIMQNVVAAACARSLKPGTKFDHCVILEGAQGFGKSTFWEQLAVLDEINYYVVASISANSHVIGTRDFLTAGSRAIFYDLDELGVLSKSDVNAVKTMLSTTMDTFRPAYGRSDIEVPRAFVCVGSTNSEVYLIDNTGNRRFWPIKVGEGMRRFDMAWLVKHREQLWAEAMYMLRSGLQFWTLPEEYEAMVIAEQESRMVDDGFTDQVAGVLNTAFASSPVNRPEVVNLQARECYFLSNIRVYDALNIPQERRMGYARRIPQVVKKVGGGNWHRALVYSGGKMGRGYAVDKAWADAQERVDVDVPKY